MLQIDKQPKFGQEGDDESSISMHTSQINCDGEITDPEMLFIDDFAKVDNVDFTARSKQNALFPGAKQDSNIMDISRNNKSRNKDKQMNRRSMSNSDSDMSFDRTNGRNSNRRGNQSYLKVNREEERRNKYRDKSQDSGSDDVKGDKNRRIS